MYRLVRERDMRTTPAKSKSPTWPYIAMVAALFLGSILATRTYRRPEPAAPELAEAEASTAAVAARPPVELEVPRVQPFEVVKPPEKPEPPTSPLAVFAAPAAVARIAPPVADRVPPELVMQSTESRVVSSAPPAVAGPQAVRVARRLPQLPPVGQPPLLRRQTLAAPPSEPDAWPFPRALAEQIEAVGRFTEATEWSAECLTVINRLSHCPSHQDLEAEQHLNQLRQLVGSARNLAKQIREPSCRTALLRAAYAIQRRESVWRRVHQLASRSATRRSVSDGEQDMRTVVASLRRWLVEQDSEPWAQFLGLDKADAIAKNSNSTSSDMQQHARIILTRLELPDLNEGQLQFLAAEPIAAYQLRLRHWAAEPFNYMRLLQEVEEFELTPGERQGEVLAERIATMRWSDRESERELAEQLSVFYRNANFRITLSDDFVNRLLPPPQSFLEDVDDYVVGAHVVGRSETSADLSIRLEPSPRRWQMTFEATGFVASETASTRGPVTTFQDGLSEYLVRKHLAVDPTEGVMSSPSEAFAASESDLVGLRTDFDGVPLLNFIARSLALQQYDSAAGEARYAVDNKVASRAQSRVDTEIEQRLNEIEQRLSTSVMDPLAELRLDPTVTDMQTLNGALVARFRLADKDQLAAFTPRPREPQGSMISVQLHESALNNAIEGLQLAGQRIELTELYRKISRLANAADQPVELPEELPRNVYVTFVDQDPIRVRFRDGRLHLSIDVKTLESEEKSWGRFGVDIYYRPDPDQVEANLVRDGVIEVRGHMSFRDRIPLRAVFGKVFAKNREITLLNDHLQEGTRLQGLRVSQFVMRDGWLGLAISPRETAANEPESDLVR